MRKNTLITSEYGLGKNDKGKCYYDQGNATERLRSCRPVLA